MANQNGSDETPAMEDGTPEHTGTELHPSQVEGYDPKFDRLSTTRRVLGHITEEVDVDSLGPRNTLEALAHGLVTDANTQINGSQEQAAVVVQEHLDKLEEAGLVSHRADGSYKVTAAGLTELRN